MWLVISREQPARLDGAPRIHTHHVREEIDTHLRIIGDYAEVLAIIPIGPKDVIA